PATATLLFYSYGHHRALHSFPTRRSSDLPSADDWGASPGEPEAAPAATPPATSTAPAAAALSGAAAATPAAATPAAGQGSGGGGDRKSTRLNSSHLGISYAVFCLKKKKKT